MQDRRLLLQSLLLGLAGAAPSRAEARVLRREALNGALSDFEAVWIDLTIEPGAPSRVHKHAGPVFGFVLEGRFRFGVRGGEERVLGPGDTFYEPFDAIHETSANAGDELVRIAVLILGAPGAPLTTPI